MAPRRPRPPHRSARLAPLLDRFQRGFDSAARLSADPVEFPRRYADPGDAEVAGILAACLAYGRADVFKVKVEQVLAAGGPSPAAFAARLAREPDAGVLGAFRYRFNTGEDVAALLAAVGWVRATHGSLGSRFAGLLGEAAAGKAPLREALTGFAAELRSAPPAQENPPGARRPGASPPLPRPGGRRGGQAMEPVPALDGARPRRRGPGHLARRGSGSPRRPARHPRGPGGAKARPHPPEGPLLAHRRGGDGGAAGGRPPRPGPLRLRALPPGDERPLPAAPGAGTVRGLRTLGGVRGGRSTRRRGQRAGFSGGPR